MGLEAAGGGGGGGLDLEAAGGAGGGFGLARRVKVGGTTSDSGGVVSGAQRA